MEGEAEFEIRIREENGFDSNPAYITLPTGGSLQAQPHDNRSSLYQQHGWKGTPRRAHDPETGGSNTGAGLARNVNAEVELPFNVFTAGQNSFSLGDLGPGDFKILDIEFFTNRRYDQPNVPVKVNVTENSGGTVLSETFTVNMNQELEVDARVVIRPNDKPSEVKISGSAASLGCRS